MALRRGVVAGLAGAAALLTGAGLVAFLLPQAGRALPAAVLTSGTEFGISGSVTGLAPGVRATLTLVVQNPAAFPITVTEVTIAVPVPPAGCPAANLRIGGLALTGSPPAVTVSRLAQRVPGAGSASFGVPILLARTAPNRCQTVTFSFAYHGTASSQPGPPHHRRGLLVLLTAHPDPSLSGQQVRFTAGVLAIGLPRPHGTVTFYLCLRRLVALHRPVPAGRGGTASISTASLPPGRQAICAVFDPARHAEEPAWSNTVVQVVGVRRPG